VNWLLRRWKATLVALVLFGVGIVIGVGSESVGEHTTTEVINHVRTKRIVRTRTVKVHPMITRTETRTRTRVVTQPPTSSFLDYGEWRGHFRAYGINGYQADFGWKVVGQIEYLGGIPNCGRISYLEITATFYQSGDVVATDIDNMTSVAVGSRVPFEINDLDGSGDFRYELLITQVNCE
jgi:hypothetical protein